MPEGKNDKELLRAYHELGRELQDYCWFLYAICAHPEKAST